MMVMMHVHGEWINKSDSCSTDEQFCPNHEKKSLEANTQFAKAEC